MSDEFETLQNYAEDPMTYADELDELHGQIFSTMQEKYPGLSERDFMKIVKQPGIRAGLFQTALNKTTNDAKDAWFAGFNGKLVAIAWVGFDQPRSLGNREFGSSIALPIWLDFIKNNLEEIPIDTSIPPKGIVAVKIDKTTGKRVGEDSNNSIFEYYLEEKSP